MLKILKVNSPEKLKKKFHNHPLLLTCQQAFRHYMANMEMLDYTSEELFVEAAEVIDKILCEPQVAPEYIVSLWDNLKIKLRKNARGTSPQNDLNMVCGVLFYVVAATLRLHWREYYNTELVNQLKSIVEHNGLFTNPDEEKSIINNLCTNAEELGNWINQYEDSDELLSAEIAKCLQRRKPEPKEDIGTRQKSDYSKYSFSLKVPKKYQGQESIVLGWLHDELVDKKYIEDYDIPQTDDLLLHIMSADERNKTIFNAVFSGKDIDYHIVWIGRKVELRYFILQLIERGALKWKPGPGKWQVTRNRIWYKKEIGKDFSDATGREYPKYQYVQFGEHDLDKGNTPKNTLQLDRIIDIIAPSNEKKLKDRIESGIKEEFKENADYESNNANNIGEKLSNGYRDTSHKGRK